MTIIISMIIILIQHSSLLIICWHSSHKAIYRDNKGTQRKHTNNKQQTKKHRKDIIINTKSHVKNSIINNNY